MLQFALWRTGLHVLFLCNFCCSVGRTHPRVHARIPTIVSNLQFWKWMFTRHWVLLSSDSPCLYCQKQFSSFHPKLTFFSPNSVFGILSAQVYTYYHRYPLDKNPYKVLVRSAYFVLADLDWLGWAGWIAMVCLRFVNTLHGVEYGGDSGYLSSDIPCWPPISCMCIQSGTSI